MVIHQLICDEAYDFVVSYPFQGEFWSNELDDYQKKK